MTKHVLIFRSEIAAPAAEVFEWHAREGGFQRYNPPWDPVKMVESKGTINPGDYKIIRMWTGPIPRNWHAQHTDLEPGKMFRDVQISGPFHSWEHTHTVIPISEDRCELEDRLEFVLPYGWVGNLVGYRSIRHTLQSVFAYRHKVIQNDCKTLQRYKGKKAMKVLISGATGLVGGELSAFLSAGGHDVVTLTRQDLPNAVQWHPTEGKIDRDKLEGFDAVVHLAGESIVGRWSEEKKKRILDSRVNGTKLLCETLATLQTPPKVLVSASAIGFYGDRGNEVLTEESSIGDMYLSKVCQQWEEATAPAKNAGIRVVNSRIGVVLTPKGGALGQMLTPFKLGGGGIIGSGEQWMSWIALDDVISGLYHCMQEESLSGPVNLVAPNPVTNYDFTKTLGKVLWRPTIFPMPSFAARMLFGQMADELLLASARVHPTRLQSTAYDFQYAELENALRHVLGKDTKQPEPVATAS